MPGYVGGRSINLALAERGMHALRLAGDGTEVLAQAVMMRGRMVHDADGAPSLQRYGARRQRSDLVDQPRPLNITLLDAAEAGGRAHPFRPAALDGSISTRSSCACSDQARARDPRMSSACSSARTAPVRPCAAPWARRDLGEVFEPLGHGYKELEIPPAADGGFQPGAATRCTSGRAAATCASRCPMPTAVSP